jgi:hypothetical protein
MPETKITDSPVTQTRVIARSACDEAIQGASTVLATLDRHAAKWRLAMTANTLEIITLT